MRGDFLPEEEVLVGGIRASRIRSVFCGWDLDLQIHLILLLAASSSRVAEAQLGVLPPITLEGAVLEHLSLDVKF